MLHLWPRLLESSCELEYLMRIRICCQEIQEIARQNTNYRVRIQVGSRSRGGLRIRDYAIGDKVWRYWPPHKRLKLEKVKWKGPYMVLDYDKDHHVVLIEVPTVGAGNKTERKWIHVSHIKPVKESEHGHLLIAIAP